ncbi:MAG: di-heme oxidoredictase family protein, partial [Pseudomonadota bacterium]
DARDPLSPGGRYLTFDANHDGERALAAAYDPGQQLLRGRIAFHQDWSKVPVGRHGVAAGPAFDATACSTCHVETASRQPSLQAPLVARTTWRQHQLTYGEQINLHHVESPAVSVVDIDYETVAFRYPNGDERELRKPVAHARLGDQRIPVSLRAAPLLFGWGLIEHADREIIRHFDDPDDRNGDGISGRMVRSASVDRRAESRLGFLGWKSAHASLEEQIGAALANDMGVLSRAICANCLEEISAGDLRALTEFVSHIGVPERRAQVSRRGQDLFGLTGCSDCHIPALLTNEDAPPAFARQLIWPYSDLMLHDLGEGLADAGDLADRREWRTAPLWGIGIVERRYPERGFLHDGRARTVEEAILWHGGEAGMARQRFVDLDETDRALLLGFVRSR